MLLRDLFLLGNWVDMWKVETCDLKWKEKGIKQLRRMAVVDTCKKKKEKRSPERLIGKANVPVEVELIGVGRE